MKVYPALGNGIQTVSYQRCWAIELERAGLEFAREQEQDILCNGKKLGKRSADFLVDDRVIRGIKAVIICLAAHLAQVKKDVVAYPKEIGLLIHVAANRLQFKKIFNAQRDKLKKRENIILTETHIQEKYR